MDGQHLEKVYMKMKSGRASSAAVHSVGLGLNGMPASDPIVTAIPPKSRGG